MCFLVMSYYWTTAAENMTLGTQECNKQTSLPEVLYAANYTHGNDQQNIRD